MAGLGYIKLYRQITENELYFSERFTKMQAWIDLLLLANHKPATVFIRGVEVHVERGEMCYSLVSLGKRWRWNVRTVNRFISRLERRGMIHSRKSNVTTIITIQNYSNYQDRTEQSTEQSTEQNGERVHGRVQTNKNDKNGKKSFSDEEKAVAIYDHYARSVRAGARSDALRNIGKLLKQGFTETQLNSCINRYAGNGMPKDQQYRIQANNFFGQKERFRDYLLSTVVAECGAGTQALTPAQKYFLEEQDA